MSVGIIVGRFQVAYLHAGHMTLIRAISERHGKTLVLLGCSSLRLTKPDPLDYPTRERMFRDAFPQATVAPLQDLPSDELWSAALDDTVRTLFPTDTDVTLYGSRESFLPHYVGDFKTDEIEAVNAPTGTEIRTLLGQQVRNSTSFRHGVIYATQNKFPISYQVVDTAILRPQGVHGPLAVLLGRKPKEAETGKWRFPGGFVSPQDANLEAAARREAHEECGDIEIGTPIYIGSTRIHDWRFHAEDQLMSAFFVVPYSYGIASGADDLAVVQWVPISEVPDCLITAHRPLGTMLIGYLNKQHFAAFGTGMNL